MAAAVRGLCTSNLSPSTSYPSSSSRLSSSSSRTTFFSTKHELQSRMSNSSIKQCKKVVVAVLVDPKVKSSQASESARITSTDASDLRTFKTVEILKKPSPTMGLSDTYLESTLEHRLWVTFGAATVTGMMAKAVMSCQSSEELLQVAAGALSAYILSDLATGIYHWGVDNYGDANTPIFGSQIDAFQGHHQRPWTITKRQFANNLHALARPAGLFLTPFLLVLPGAPFADSFLGAFLGCVVMSQQFHAWSHMKKSQLPSAVVSLQDAGVLVSRKMHGAHHKPPYDVNYCIVSGIWNPALEKTQIFKKLERWGYTKFGVAPRAWSETSEEWLQTGTYFEDGTDIESSQISS